MLHKDWKTVLTGVFALATATGGYYVVTSYLLSYGTESLHLSESMLLNGLSLAAFLELVVTPLLALLGDKVGAHKVVVAGLAGVVLLSIPQFMVLGGGSVVLIYLMMLAMRLVMSALYGPMAAILADGFAPHVRYTGISLSYQVCNMIFAGFAPVTAVWLSSLVGGAYWPCGRRADGGLRGRHLVHAAAAGPLRAPGRGRVHGRDPGEGVRLVALGLRHTRLEMRLGGLVLIASGCALSPAFRSSAPTTFDSTTLPSESLKST